MVEVPEGWEASFFLGHCPNFVGANGRKDVMNKTSWMALVMLVKWLWFLHAC